MTKVYSACQRRLPGLARICHAKIMKKKKRRNPIKLKEQRARATSRNRGYSFIGGLGSRHVANFPFRFISLNLCFSFSPLLFKSFAVEVARLQSWILQLGNNTRAPWRMGEFRHQVTCRQRGDFFHFYFIFYFGKTMS